LSTDVGEIVAGADGIAVHVMPEAAYSVHPRRHPRTLLSWVFLVAALCLRPARAAEEITTNNYPNGKPKETYTVDAEGKKNGVCKEYYEDGTLKLRAGYKAGVLHGDYLSLWPGEKVHVKASYRNGKLHGSYEGLDEKERPVKHAVYRDGLLHGACREYEDGKLVRDQTWLEGMLLYPKSAAQIETGLARIKSAKVEFVGQKPDESVWSGPVKPDPPDPKKPPQPRKPAPPENQDEERIEAVRTLMAYRFLCDVPYQDIKLDRMYNAHTEAACELLHKIGHLDHTPPNPGMPEKDYKFALKGTNSSNLYAGSSSLVGAVHGWMDDSDPSNIDRVGHRRWCLNPAMQKTGLSAGGGFAAMWSFDSSRKSVPDYEFVCFPPRGLMPNPYFNPHYAWSVSLNGRKYAAPAKDSVKVAVYPLSGSFVKAKEPLPLNYFNVNKAGFGVPYCIIFRPNDIKTVPKSRYQVEITGVKKKDGSPAEIKYVVEFTGPRG
jgi:hypothetical protein